MAKILLDYVFPISVITPTPAASTAFLKQVCVVAKPKSGQEGNVGTIFECTSNSAVAVRTDNVDCAQLFAAGMTKVFLLLADDLDIATFLEAEAGEFYTVLISSDFAESEITLAQADGTITITSYTNLLDTSADTITVAGVAFVAQSSAVVEGAATFRAATSNEATAASLAAQINAHATSGALVEATVENAVVTVTAKLAGSAGNDIAVSYTDGSPTTVGATLGGLSGGKLAGGAGLLVGDFEGVIGMSSDDDTFLENNAAIENQVAFFTKTANGAKNMFYAFGSLLSNLSNWRNQQYISMPVNDDIDDLGEANGYFDDKVSFVLNDTQYGNRLGLFAVGGKAIVAPYILKNLRVDLQSRALNWIASNQPQYTLKEASLLETRLQEDVINLYISLGWITEGTVTISLVQGNFVANGEITVPEPKALWRIYGEMVETS